MLPTEEPEEASRLHVVIHCRSIQFPHAMKSVLISQTLLKCTQNSYCNVHQLIGLASCHTWQGFSQDFRIGCPKIHIWGELGVKYSNSFSSHCIIQKNMDSRVSKISNRVSKRHPDTPLAKGPTLGILYAGVDWEQNPAQALSKCLTGYSTHPCWLIIMTMIMIIRITIIIQIQHKFIQIQINTTNTYY